MEKKNRKCDKKEYIISGPKLENGSSLFLKHNEDHTYSTGLLSPLENGKPIPEGSIIAKRIEDGPYYEVITTVNSHKSKISNTAYRDGWDKIFKYDNKNNNINYN